MEIGSGKGMVDITGKPVSYREAEAEGRIYLRKETIKRIREGRVEKGDIFEASRIAAIQGVKKTPEVIPLCHPIKITSVKVSHRVEDDHITLSVTVKAEEKTGVEMEALTGLSLGLLTIWDMVKMYEKDEEGGYPYTKITKVRVKRKVKKPLG